ncbi:MAG: Formamidopyrimidine-DNA glycosylase catalytic domain protein [Gemmatimonadetes bacterium]|nr:Formamidopyrimidine-DNA glycosylase catalytic domain protein [Gemmatimonadota bacterium]
MPELPDVTLYVEALDARVVGQPLLECVILSPFVLRSFDPPLSSVAGRIVRGVQRMGKRIVLELDDEHFIVIHLMIAGRLRWTPATSRKRAPTKFTLAELRFPNGTVVFTEAGSQRRASIHLVNGRENLAPFERGGLEVLDASEAEFAERLRSENHTMKRALTDPRLFSGIGNTYSDEILHRARLSPMKLTSRLSEDEVTRLFPATVATLVDWTTRLREELQGEFPDKVTAFHEGMAVHGRYNQPCPDCGAPVQRIRYKSNETNYCARCQTEGRLLADRGLSRLLKEDWPRSLDEL